ncbi:flavin monoamine oxidase family protein [Paenibacillus sp. GCM10027629]|uniref:flavin monoamine oxidase family protein n=1 Tax=Paenibacillus sp. GCM10027629 TaxID=3273414 RepID=UPI00363E159E
MSKSPFMRQLNSAANVAGEASERNVTVEQVIEERIQKSASRREILQKTVKASTARVIPSAKENMAKAPIAPRVVVVGAGLAGLSAAYRLKQAGIHAQVYEASSRVGGRCWTGRNDFNEGQSYEHGGELINSSHTALLNLIGELNLQMDDLWAYEEGDFRIVLDGSICPFDMLAKAFMEIRPQLLKDRREAGDITLYNQYTPRGYELDHMSIVDWINTYVPGGMSSKFGKAVALAYTASVGLESTEVSALLMVYAMSTATENDFSPFGSDGDERYRVQGGNDLIPQSLADHLDGQITMSSPLEALVQNGNGTYTLHFSGRRRGVQADYVILALPVSTLRDVDLSRSGFRDLKLEAIAEMGVSTNSKLAMQFTNRHWMSHSSSGSFVSNGGYQNTWDATRAQAGESGILVNFTGGSIGHQFGTGSEHDHAARFLQLMEHDLPGLTDKWNGKAVLDYWPGQRWAKGSYSCYKLGQYTKYRGVFGEPEGNCFFAGEHTSLQYQQFFNGAVETGERAAKEVLSKLEQRHARMT